MKRVIFAAGAAVVAIAATQWLKKRQEHKKVQERVRRVMENG